MRGAGSDERPSASSAEIEGTDDSGIRSAPSPRGLYADHSPVASPDRSLFDFPSNDGRCAERAARCIASSKAGDQVETGLVDQRNLSSLLRGVCLNAGQRGC